MVALIPVSWSNAFISFGLTFIKVPLKPIKFLLKLKQSNQINIA